MIRNIAGALGIVGSTGLIFYALYLSKSPSCLWGILLVIIFVEVFPWAKEKKGK